MKIKNLLTACALAAIASFTAFAQVGRIEGDVVKADTKEPIPSAKVQIVREDIKGNYDVNSDKKGHFLHAGVPYVGRYTLIISAPNCEPQYQSGIRPTGEPLKIELRPGDGRVLTIDDVRKAQSSGGGAKPGGQQVNAAEAKKQAEEYEKKRAEIDAANKKAAADYESIKKLFDSGLAKLNAKDYPGAVTDLNEAARIDAEQQAVWQALSLALFNRGVTYFNEGMKDPSKKDLAKQDFNDCINAANKALALVEPQLADPAKAAVGKKNKASYLKTRADAESLLAKRLAVPEMAEPANKDYLAAAELSDNPAEKKSFAIKGGETLREAGKNDEAVAAFQAILQSDPDNIEVYYNLGLIYSATEKTWQESANMFQKFVDKAPESDTRVVEAKAIIGELIKGNNIVV